MKWGRAGQTAKGVGGLGTEAEFIIGLAGTQRDKLAWIRFWKGTYGCHKAKGQFKILIRAALEKSHYLEMNVNEEHHL